MTRNFWISLVGGFTCYSNGVNISILNLMLNNLLKKKDPLQLNLIKEVNKSTKDRNFQKVSMPN